jgi:hypothetical protein
VAQIYWLRVSRTEGRTKHGHRELQRWDFSVATPLFHLTPGSNCSYRNALWQPSNRKKSNVKEGIGHGISGPANPRLGRGRARLCATKGLLAVPYGSSAGGALGCWQQHAGNGRAAVHEERGGLSNSTPAMAEMLCTGREEGWAPLAAPGCWPPRQGARPWTFLRGRWPPVGLGRRRD